MKKVKQFHLKIVIFTAVKYRCLLHGNVFDSSIVPLDRTDTINLCFEQQKKEKK